MKRMTLAAILGVLFGYGTFVSGQNPSVTNLAGRRSRMPMKWFMMSPPAGSNGAVR